MVAVAVVLLFMPLLLRLGVRAEVAMVMVVVLSAVVAVVVAMAVVAVAALLHTITRASVNCFFVCHPRAFLDKRRARVVSWVP